MKQITIIIPIREGETAKTTLKSLKTQNFKNYKTIIVSDENKGANYARNKGAKLAKTNLLLFCDNDIEWYKNGITALFKTLLANPDKAYSYGAYILYHKGFPEVLFGDMEFDPVILEDHNYISTMSLVKKKDFEEVGSFDENITRFQDWDLWLTMLKYGKEGVWCKELIFKSKSRLKKPDPIKYFKLKSIVKQKYERSKNNIYC